jgi:hypothetical protein
MPIQFPLRFDEVPVTCPGIELVSGRATGVDDSAAHPTRTLVLSSAGKITLNVPCSLD